jgi:hypothetical protein
MNRSDDVRSGQGENVRVAPKVARMVLEPLAAEVGLGQAVPLDERSGGSIEYQDSVLQKWPKQEQALSARPRVA